MRKILSNKIFLLLSLFTGMALASCLKDKGFENGEYQTINSNVEGQEWLSIPLAARKPNTLGLESKAGFQTVPLFPVSYDFKDPAPQDITVTIAVNNTVAADQAPDADVLPTSAYTIPANTVTIPAGQRVSDAFPISVNTSLLDPTKTYAIGFSVTSVSKSGVSLPSNMKDVVFVFTIKNRFDGIYQARFRMAPGADRAASWAGPYVYPYDIEMITTGPNTVEMNNTAFGVGYHPLMTPSVSGFGSTTPVFTFDDSNKLVSVENIWPGSTRSFRLNPAVTDSRFDPATKTIYAAIIMDQTGFEPLPIFDTFKFVKARP